MALRIEVDRELCDGYGNCVFVAPEVFDLDDDNRVRLLVTVVDESRREEVELAIAECPTRAISCERVRADGEMAPTGHAGPPGRDRR